MGNPGGFATKEASNSKLAMLMGSSHRAITSGATLDHVFLYQHAKRAEWGYGAVIDSQDDRTTFKFDDGVSRTIKRDHLHMMHQVELEEPEASEVRKRIARHTKSSSLTASGEKRKPAKKKVAKKKEPVAEEAKVAT